MGIVPCNKEKLNEQKIKHLYINENLSAAAISRIYGCGVTTITTKLRNMGISIRSSLSFDKTLMKHCRWCGKKFFTYRKNQRWCSHQCRSKEKTARLNKVCRVCGRDLIRKPKEQFTAFKRRMYCSYECRKRDDNYQEYLEKVSSGWFGYGEDHPFWKGGKSPAYCRELPWSTQRIKALERDGFRCMNCGYSVLERTICVHHVIPFKKSKDNGLDNLITLCLACHRRIHAQERRRNKNGNEKGKMV